jgi:hypothetical protein
VVGTLTTAYTAQRGTVPFFFAPAYFLAMNTINVLVFAGLIFAGVAARRDTGWHRRLIYCGMASIMGPAFGRILPPPLLMAAGMPVITALLCAFVVLGAVRDRMRSGRVHPAWLVGGAVLVAQWGVIEWVGNSRLGVSIYESVVAGTPGAAKPALEKGVMPG